jgi:hypothetical protein
LENSTGERVVRRTYTTVKIKRRTHLVTRSTRGEFFGSEREAYQQEQELERERE